MSSLIDKSSAVAEMGNRSATVHMGRKVVGCCGPFRGGIGSPSNTMSPGPRLTSVPSGTLVHLTVWLQYINVTDSDRQDIQRGQDNGPVVFGEPLLVTFAQ